MAEFQTFPIVLNQSNLTNATTNATFTYKLPGNSSSFKKADVCISQINMYNNMFNINAQLYNNNTFSIIFPITSGGVDSTYTLNISIPNGYFNNNDINNFVQQQMIAQGLYLTKSGQNVYFWSIQDNANEYATQINEFSVPLLSTYAAAGYSLPSSGQWSGTGLPMTNAYTPRTVIANNGFSAVVGFTPGTYPTPAQTATYSKISDFTPQISPVQSLNVHCSLVNSVYTVPPDYIANINPNSVQYGKLYTYQPSNYQWLTIPDQTVSAITIYFTDQNNNGIVLNDPNTTICLLIRIKTN